MKKRTEKTVSFTVFCALSLILAMLLCSCTLTDFIFGNETEDITSGSVDITEPGVNTDSPGTSGPEDSTSEPSVTTGPESTTDAGSEETTDAEVILYRDPLTGIFGTVDYSSVRPVAIVVDNLSVSSPQSGVYSADIMIECMVEGGISRLILITNKYSGNEVYGPVRSTRDYMVYLSQAFGTLMVGAGYSDNVGIDNAHSGYLAIKNNGFQYLDGTHDRYASSCFIRDPARMATSGYEHSLMITGMGIKALAAHNNFPLVVTSLEPVFNFADIRSSAVEPEDSSAVITEAVTDAVTEPVTEPVTGTGEAEPAVSPEEPVGSEAIHTILTYSTYQQVQLIYSRSENAYYRYQYGTTAHMDAENGKQLRFENVLLLFAKQNSIAGDTEGRISIETTGTGTGYFLTGGKYIEIKWSRSGISDPFVFTDNEGNTFEFTPGKTMISIIDSKLKNTDSVILNYAIEVPEETTEITTESTEITTEANPT